MGGFGTKQNLSPNSLTAAEQSWVQSGADSGILKLLETVAPGATTGVGKVYAKAADHKLYYLDQAGTETVIQTGSEAFVNPMTTSGDTIYGGASGTATRLAGNITATKKFLTQTGNGSISAAPAWNTIAAGDVPTLNQSTTGSAATLTTPRAIYGNNFDGSAALTQVIAGTYGGTGVNNAAKTLTYLKNISFTSADDTGVYTLPTGTKTLLATDGAGTSLTGIPYTITGTANQVIASAGTGNITLSLPQSIATSSSVTFANLTISSVVKSSIAGTPNYLANDGTAHYFQSPGSLILQSNTAVASKSAILNTSGSFGLGTLGPIVKLHVGAGASITASSTETLIYAANAGATNIACRDDTNAVEGLYYAYSGGVLMGVTTNHSLGLRTNNTTQITLSTAGNVRFHNYGAGTLTTDASGNITAISDERLKNIQGQFTSGLDALKAIEPILYKWNEKSGMETNGVYAGFSAQNVQANIPEAIGQNSEGILSIQDRALLATVVNALKELNTRVEKIENN